VLINLILGIVHTNIQIWQDDADKAKNSTHTAVLYSLICTCHQHLFQDQVKITATATAKTGQCQEPEHSTVFIILNCLLDKTALHQKKVS